MKNRILALFLAAVLFVLPTACGTAAGGTSGTDSSGEASAAPAVAAITPEEVKALLDSGEDFVLLDVRTQSEFDRGHIPGALLIPDTELADRAGDELPDKDGLIVLYCRSGRRSAASAADLIDRGYTQVYDMGGINDWPYDVVQ
jgi:phage shock protein E